MRHRRFTLPYLPLRQLRKYKSMRKFRTICMSPQTEFECSQFDGDGLIQARNVLLSPEPVLKATKIVRALVFIQVRNGILLLELVVDKLRRDPGQWWLPEIDSGRPSVMALPKSTSVRGFSTVISVRSFSRAIAQGLLVLDVLSWLARM